METTGGGGFGERQPAFTATMEPAIAYMLVSSALSVLNRHLYHRTPPFRFPSLLISCQAFVIGLLTLIGVRKYWRVECRASEYWPSQHLESSSFVRVAAVGLLFGADIFFTQFALLHGPVSLVELMKCLIPVIVFVQVSMLKWKPPALQESAMMILITSGVVLATGSGGVAYNMEPGGFMMAACATMAGATRVCGMQMVLHGERRCPMPLVLLYVVPALFFTGTMLFFLFELRDFAEIPEAIRPAHLAGTLGLITLSSLLAFMLNLSELWCVREASALFLTLIGALKVVLLILLTALAARRMLSFKAVLGSVMAVGGVVLMKLSTPQVARPHSDSNTPMELRGTMLNADNCGEDSS